MENKTHLNVFDFDETLFRVPNYTCKEANGMEPYEWFDNPASLDQDFNIKPIMNVIEAAQDNKVHNCLITHRTQNCKEAVDRLLREHNISFDRLFFLGRADAKARSVKSILVDHPEIKTVTIYEDTIWEIMRYVEYFTENPQPVKFDFAFIDKSKMIKFIWPVASVMTFSGYTAQRLIID